MHTEARIFSRAIQAFLVVCGVVFLYNSANQVQATTEEEEATTTKDAAADGEQGGSITGKRVLVFGGNGFMGAETVEKLLDDADADYSVTIVNRGNWYWDSKDRIKSRVANAILCDRKKDGGLAACPELVTFADTVDKFDVVIDFSAYSGDVVKDAVKFLKDKDIAVGLYVLISTDSIYDVCEKDHDGPSKETDAIRVQDPSDRDTVNRHHDYGHRKLQAEEELTQQRQDGGAGGGFPYFILRLPDVIGPRDTTYRWWIYQLWVGLAQRIPESPVHIPPFLDNYPISFVYANDVATAIELAVHAGSKVHDEVVNLAWPEPITMLDLMKDIEKHLGVKDLEIITDDSSESAHFYMYPSVRKGAIDVSKVQELLGWEPTPWDEALETTIRFHQDAMKNDKFVIQRDEIVQIVGAHLYEQIKEKMYSELEKQFDIALHHFRPRDEL